MDTNMEQNKIRRSECHCRAQSREIKKGFAEVKDAVTGSRIDVRYEKTKIRWHAGHHWNKVPNC